MPLLSDKAQKAQILAGEERIGAVGGSTAIATAALNRPADTTAYAVGDLVANSATAGSVVPLQLPAARKNGGTGRITRARLTKSSPSLTNALFRVHLFRTAPGVTVGDNGALAGAMSGALAYLGAVDVTMDQAFTDGAKGFASPNEGFLSFEAAAGSQALYALIEARGAYTPASAETFTLALEVDRD